MNKYIGDRQFYKTLFKVAAPLVLQQLITTSVQLVDNVMVGRLGEQSIAAVSVVNQLYFIVILITFGAMGGAGIFTAQFFGSKDFDKLKQTYRFKLMIGLGVAILSFLIFTFFGRSLISLFTSNEDTINLALGYLSYARWSAFPWIIAVAIGNTFRETGITKPLLYISLVSITTNTILNYLLIFGNFGAPNLGVEGAAIATLIARFVEFGLTWILLKKRGQHFDTTMKSVFAIDKKLLGGMIVMALPLMLNETLWSSGQTVFLYAYSTRGDQALAAMNITGAISQIVFVTFGAIATAVAVLVGNTLGRNELEEAKANSKKLFATAIMVAVVAGMILFTLSFFILNIYDVADITKQTAQFNIRINALFIPVYSFNVTLYFTLRAGGDTKSTVLMDAGYMWVIPVPVSLLLAYLTHLPVTMMFLIIQSLEIPKMLFGLTRYRMNRWVRNLAHEH
jgi:putative MATE family efflux protein